VPSTTRLITRLRDLVSRNPVPGLAVALAVRAALAAVLAWMLVLPFGGLADDYPYYAPLGAVVAVSTTVVRSLRTSLEVFLALTIGALLATSVHALGLPSPLAVGLVVGLGTLVSAHPWLGTMGSWAPVSALFVLILGGDHPLDFVLGYLGFTTLGAVVGSAVNLAFPPLLLSDTRHAQDTLRDELVEHLRRLADALKGGEPPPKDRLTAEHEALRHRSRTIEDSVAQAVEGPPVNWRVRRWRDSAEQLREQGRALVALSLLVTEMSDMLARQAAHETAQAPWGNDLTVPTVAVLDAVADVLASVEGASAGADEVARARSAADELDEAARSLSGLDSDDLFTAGALVLGVRRTLDTVAPRES
jgi:uncharacterized membrane protein YgaE (UPF0421/DUF939 family)